MDLVFTYIFLSYRDYAGRELRKQNLIEEQLCQMLQNELFTRSVPVDLLLDLRSTQFLDYFKSKKLVSLLFSTRVLQKLVSILLFSI